LPGLKISTKFQKLDVGFTEKSFLRQDLQVTPENFTVLTETASDMKHCFEKTWCAALRLRPAPHLRVYFMGLFTVWGSPPGHEMPW
jgi:hypothetical protein